MISPRSMQPGHGPATRRPRRGSLDLGAIIQPGDQRAVQVTAGTELVPGALPMNPKVAGCVLVGEAFQLRFAALTEDPLTFSVAFQDWLIVWPSVYVQL